MPSGNAYDDSLLALIRPAPDENIKHLRMASFSGVGERNQSAEN